MVEFFWCCYSTLLSIPEVLTYAYSIEVVIKTADLDDWVADLDDWVADLDMTQMCDLD